MLDITAIVSQAIESVLAERTTPDDRPRAALASTNAGVWESDLRLHAIRSAYVTYVNAHGHRYERVVLNRVRGIGMWEVLHNGRFVGATYAHKVAITQENGTFIVTQK